MAKSAHVTLLDLAASRCVSKGECNNRYSERHNDTETDLDLDTDIVIWNMMMRIPEETVLLLEHGK